MFCTSCGKDVDQTWKFCQNCGVELKKRQAQADTSKGTAEESATKSSPEEIGPDFGLRRPLVPWPEEEPQNSVSEFAPRQEEVVKTKSRRVLGVFALVFALAIAGVTVTVQNQDSSPTTIATESSSTIVFGSSVEQACKALFDASKALSVYSDEINSSTINQLNPVQSPIRSELEALKKAKDRLGTGTSFKALLVDQTYNFGQISSGLVYGNIETVRTGEERFRRLADEHDAYCSGKLAPSSLESSLSRMDCAVVESNITMVRTVFTEGTATPSQIAAILRSAASEWSNVATNQLGSRESWLRKMTSLSLSIRLYILNGSPTNGEQLLDQLGNNFNLSAQFCG